MRVVLSPEVIDWIIDVTCKDRSYGARPLRRAIQRYIEDPLAEELIRGHLQGGEIEVYLESGPAGLSAGRRAGRGRPPAVGQRLKCSRIQGSTSQRSGRGPVYSYDSHEFGPIRGRL